MNGRWLVVDTLKPRSQMKAGNRTDPEPKVSEKPTPIKDSGPRKPRFNKWAGLAPTKENNKTTFDSD